MPKNYTNSSNIISKREKKNERRRRDQTRNLTTNTRRNTRRDLVKRRRIIILPNDCIIWTKIATATVHGVIQQARHTAVVTSHHSVKHLATILKSRVQLTDGRDLVH